MGVVLGIDVGSLTTKIVVLAGDKEVWSSYRRSAGQPVVALQEGFRELCGVVDGDEVQAVGATGSGRWLAAAAVGADVVRNEITAHAMAARHELLGARTVIDIGGQDSKVIFLSEDGAVGFNMNTVCAAGTGSFLDQQAARLGVGIEEFGELALRSARPAHIAGRCGVFAESDLIHKQQLGHCREDLAAGLCLALARNYVANVLHGRKVQAEVLFQGGVAGNRGLRAALEQVLGLPLVVPERFRVMGALGAALLARRWVESGHQTRFRGTQAVARFEAKPRGFQCPDCGNACEVNELYVDGALAGRWGGNCGKWDDLERPSARDHVSG